MYLWLMFRQGYTDFKTYATENMEKRMTAGFLKRSCAQQRAFGILLTDKFTCQRPQLYTKQVPRRSIQRRPSYQHDGQTDRRHFSFI